MGEGFKYIPKRTDANQPEIMKTLRRLGFSVESLHEVGHGIFDLLVSKHWLTLLAEVKDGDKPPSARKLTDQQVKFNFDWPGLRCVLKNNEDCLLLNDSVNRILKLTAGMGICIIGNEEEHYKPRLY